MQPVNRRVTWRPQAPPTQIRTRLRRTRVLGHTIVNDTVANALDWMGARLARNERARIAFLNAHCANLGTRDAEYGAALDSAHALLPDGAGINLALLMRGQRLRANLNGTDLIPLLCRRLAASGHSIFLLGGQMGVADAASARLIAAAPGLRIAGTHHGFFTHEEEPAVIDEINASRASVVLVAFGVPLQDVWLARHAACLNATLTLGVGGLFDFLSGRIPRAPDRLRRLGLEWTWRLRQEPARMWRRYILGNPEFAARATAHAVPLQALRVRIVTDLAAKRALDAAIGFFCLAVLSPLLLLIAAAVCLDSKGPATVSQTRIGKDGVPFAGFKFRSMVNAVEACRSSLADSNRKAGGGVTLMKVGRDPQVTRVGRLLRATAMDKLPQLLNVLNGTMSLVGPRAPLPAEAIGYTAHERRRLGCKPGITGLWQISSRANPTLSQQVELDIVYLSTRTIFLDLSIVARALPAFLSGRHAG